MPHGRKPPSRAANMEEGSLDETIVLNGDQGTGQDLNASGPRIDVDRIDSLHMKAWFGMAFRYPPNALKLVWDLCQWMVDYGSLIATLILGSIFDPNYDNIRWTILTHVLSCVFMIIIEWTRHSQSGPTKKTKRVLLFKFVANVFMILKPIRCITGYRYRKDSSKLVRDKFKLRKLLTEEEIEVVIKINRKELEDDYYNLIFVFIQSVPLCLLQLHILFSAKEKFQLCSQADFSRVLMISSTIFSIAKSTADYSWNYNKYIQGWHFLDYFRSNFTHEMNVISTQNRFTYSFHLLSNLILSMHRFYCISFFLSVSQSLCAVYISSIFLSQWLILILCPRLRYSLENAPLGVHTFCSDLFDRWVNVFTLHMMNWNSMSQKTYRMFCKFKIPIPLVHLIPFAISMVAVFLVTYSIGKTEEHVEILRSVIPALQHHLNPNNSSESLIPCTNSTFSSNVNWIQSAGNFLLSAHQKVTNRFVSFYDLFGVIHFLPFSMYAYLCVTITFSYYLRWFHLDDMKFPVQLAFEHWAKLLRIRDCDSNRKLLLLTLLSPQAFEKLQWKHRCFCLSLINYDQILNTEFHLPKNEASWWDVEAEKKISSPECPEGLREFYDYLRQNSPKKEEINQLIWLFCVRFYHQMSVMTSHRIKRTFDMCQPNGSSSRC